MSNRLQPAFWGGLFIGVLSGLPVVNFGNACCCLWVVAGGALAVWLAQSNQPYAIKAGDGAVLGLLAGIIGACIALPITLAFEGWQRDMILRLLENTDADIPPNLRELIENTGANALRRMAGFLLSLVVNAVFGLLGGLLGVAIFKKNAPPPPPGTVEVLPPEA